MKYMALSCLVYLLPYVEVATTMDCVMRQVNLVLHISPFSYTSHEVMCEVVVV